MLGRRSILFEISGPRRPIVAPCNRARTSPDFSNCPSSAQPRGERGVTLHWATRGATLVFQ